MGKGRTKRHIQANVPVHIKKETSRDDDSTRKKTNSSSLNVLKKAWKGDRVVGAKENCGDHAEN